MRPIDGPPRTTTVRGVTITRPLVSGEEVGDRLVPTPIHVRMPSVNGAPELDLQIEVLSGIPRCTELTMRSVEDGREIRPKDLDAVKLEEFIATFVALVAVQVTSRDPETGAITALSTGDPEEIARSVKAVEKARKGSRRLLTPELLKRIANLYNAQETGGLEAIESAHHVSRATAARWLKAARDAGLVER